MLGQEPPKPEFRETDEVYGRGFLVTQELVPGINLNPETIIELRRGYTLISHPGHGTLVIRNSSRVPGFDGRSLLEHPAYYDRDPLSVDKLKTYDPQKDKFHQHLLHPALYRSDPKAPSQQDDIRFLLDEMNRFRGHYKAWKGDVSSRNDATGQTGIDSSAGFFPILEKAKALAESNLFKGMERELPPEQQIALAFVDPHLPVNVRYGEPFVLAGNNLIELQHYLAGTMTEEQVIDSNFLRFIQAGVNIPDAELIITDLASDK
jgi:hypothetical protein